MVVPKSGPPWIAYSNRERELRRHRYLFSPTERYLVVLTSRRYRPLTYGIPFFQTYDIDATIKTVTKAVAMSTTEAPLRVFTLGIGEGASSAMCEGIARAGNGVCLMATSSENILGKCAKLVRASRTFILKNISVDWGTPVNKPAKSGFGFHSATRPRECLQSPTKIESLYPGLRLVVTAMIKDEAFKIPEQVILSGQRDGNGEVIEFRIPVQLVQPAEEDDTIPLVNTLAARRIITELEDPKNESQHTEEQKKATIIRFGEEYQLASRYTSFVAIGDHLSEYQKGSSKGKEKSSKREKVGHIKGSSLSNLVGNFFEAPSTEVDVAVDHNDSEDEEDEDWDFGSVTPPIEQAQMRRRHASSSAPRIPLVGGGLPTRPTGLSMFGMGRSSARTAPPPPPAFSSAPVPPPLSKKAKMWSAPPPPPIAPGGGGYCDAIQDPSILGGQEEYGSSQAKDILPTFGGEEGIDNDMSFSPRGRNAVRTPTSETSVTRLVRLQAFDGSFTLSGEFIQIVGENVAKGAQPQGVPDILWATAVAIAYIRKYLADQPELSDSLVEKAMDFVSQSLLGQGVDFKALVTKAKGFL